MRDSPPQSGPGWLSQISECRVERPIVEGVNSDTTQDKCAMLRARAELYRGLAQVGAVDQREGRLAIAAYLERQVEEAEASLLTSAGDKAQAPRPRP